jgi:hypothetical protein
MKQMIVPVIAPVFKKQVARQMENLMQLQQQQIHQFQNLAPAQAR